MRMESSSTESPPPALGTPLWDDARTPWLVFFLGFLVFSIAGLKRDIWAPDETRHAEVAAEMIRGHDYVVPRLNGEEYPDKPPPPFWLMTIPMRVFGADNAWAARLPFAIAVGLILALTYAMTRRLFDARIALTATLLLASAGEFAWLGQRVSLDVFQALFVLLAIVAWLREQRGEGSTLANGLMFFAACGAGLSTKGPTALLIPFAAVIGHGLATGTLRRLGSWRFLLGIPLMLAIVAIWLVPAARAASPEYLHAILGEKSFGRFTNAINHEHPFHYYLIEWPVEFLPWSPILLVAVFLAFKKEVECDRGAKRLLYFWIGIPFLVLSISQTKRGNYLLPLYPAAAMLCAVVLHQLDARIDSRASVVLHGILRGFALLFVIAGLIAAAIPFTRLLDEHDLPNIVPAGIVVGAVICLIGAVAFLRGGESMVTLQRTMAAGMMILVPVVGLVLAPVIDAEKSDRLIAEKLVELGARDSTKPIAFLRYSPEAARFYSGLDCREVYDRDELADALNRGEYDFAVIDSDKWEKLRQALPDTVKAGPAGKGRARLVYVIDMRP